MKRRKTFNEVARRDLNERQGKGMEEKENEEEGTKKKGRYN